MKKRLIALIVTLAAVLLAAGAIITTVLVRRRRPPDLETLRPRVIELVEAAEPLNGILWGEGLPTYPRVYEETHERTPFTYEYHGTEKTRYYYTFEDETEGRVLAYQYCLAIRGEDNTYTYVDIEHGEAPLTVSDVGVFRYAAIPAEAEIAALPWETAGFAALPDYAEPHAEFYYTATDEPYYDYVRFDSGYLSVQDIKEQMEGVFASGYCASVEESLFTGITVSERDSGTLYARYLDIENDEGGTYLMKSNTQKGFYTARRVYLFDTMRMVKPSNARYVNVEIDTYVEGAPDEIVTVRLSLSLENGAWLLDSPTY